MDRKFLAELQRTAEGAGIPVGRLVETVLTQDVDVLDGEEHERLNAYLEDERARKAFGLVMSVPDGDWVRSVADAIEDRMLDRMRKEEKSR